MSAPVIFSAVIRSGARPRPHLSLFALDLHDRIDARHAREARIFRSVAGRGTHRESVPEFSEPPSRRIPNSRR